MIVTMFTLIPHATSVSEPAPTDGQLDPFGLSTPAPAPAAKTPTTPTGPPLGGAPGMPVTTCSLHHCSLVTVLFFICYPSSHKRRV